MREPKKLLERGGVMILGAAGICGFIAMILFLKMVSFFFGDKYERWDYLNVEGFKEDLAYIIILLIVAAGLVAFSLSRQKGAADT